MRKINLNIRLAICVVVATVAGPVWNFPTVRGEALCDYPADGAVITGNTMTYLDDDYIWTMLVFVPGANAVEHVGYFSDNRDDVVNRIEDANLGPPPYASMPEWEYIFFAGHPVALPADETLVRGTKYYWAVDETDDQGQVWAGDIWEFTIQSFYATLPNPPHEATFVNTDVLLSWIPGFGVVDHDIYMGTSWQDVKDARYDPLNQPPEFVTTRVDPNYQCSGLALDTIYYWRVDQVNGRIPLFGGGEYYYGDVWWFITGAPGPIQIYLLTPNGGQTLIAGSTYLITWQTQGSIDSVKIEYSTNDGGDWTYVDTVPNTDSYQWLVPQEDSAQCLVRISDTSAPAVFDISNGVFSIILSPLVLYVDAGAAGGANNGTSWADAYNYLQDAVRAAVLGDKIRVAEGTYKPDANTANPGSGDRTATFQLKNGVTIKGGYAGWGEPDPNARDIVVYETILSGDLNGDDGPDFANNGENSYHVVTGSGTDATTILDGFTITAGNANGSGTDMAGGGMINYANGNPTITNCTFRGNSAGYGGGMYNFDHSNPTLTNCQLKGNSASSGGGMYNGYYSTPMLTNCTFSGNSASYGGGMLNHVGSDATVTNCTFSGNSAATSGGGMYNYNNSPTLTNCILWGNIDGGGMDESAQIFESSSFTTINYCCVQGWTGSFGGVGNIDENPLFKDADGPDNIIGTADDNLRLSAGSPCIDASDNTVVPTPFDLDGNPRLFDDPITADTGYPPWADAIVDMGAYEFNDRLVAHWKLNEKGGTMAWDSSGSNNHGTLYGEPNWQPGGGQIGGALEFDGVDDYVGCGTFNPSERTGQLSVTVWANWNGLNGQWQGLVAKRDIWDADDMMWQLEAALVDGALNFNSEGSYWYSGDPVLPVGEWAHVAATFDGTTCTLYLDGAYTGSGPLSLGSDTEAALVFGCGEAGGLNSFNGALDDIRLYNYALSADEVRWLLCDRPPRGDLNHDCRVDFVDFAILASSWLDCGMMVEGLCGQ